MHPNVKKGNQMHEMHFKAIADKQGYLAPGWEVYLCNKSIKGTKLRPDWVLINHGLKKGFVIDVTSKFSPRHYKKGLSYVSALEQIFTNPQWEIVYLEDYWVDRVLH